MILKQNWDIDIKLRERHVKYHPDGSVEELYNLGLASVDTTSVMKTNK